MPRVKNVDTVAPDDPIATTPSVVKVPTVAVATPTSTPKTIAQTSAANIKEKVYSIFGHTKTPFSSSLIFPDVFSFAEQDDDETILIAMRPHWFTNVHWIIISTILFLSPGLLRFVPLMNTLPWNYQFIISLSWYMVSIAYTFEKFLGWYFNVYIVTNERVIDIDFINLLTKKFAEADIDKIQDVSSQVAGVSQTFFNYGSVLIQTASEVNELHFEKIPNPEKVVKIIQELEEVTGSKNV